MYRDPAVTDPELYRVVLENDRIRVLEYRDRPGEKTCEHDHPDMVVIPLTGFRRRQRMGGEQVVEFEKAAFDVAWADAMTHAGENIGDTPSHALFVELHTRIATMLLAAWRSWTTQVDLRQDGCRVRAISPVPMPLQHESRRDVRAPTVGSQR